MSRVTIEPPPEALETPEEPELVRQAVDAAVDAKPRAESLDRPTDGRATTVERAAPEVVPPSSDERLRTPLWARVTAAIWLLLLGILIGGAAIPHASDEPRIAPRNGDAPNAICLPPSPRK